MVKCINAVKNHRVKTKSVRGSRLPFSHYEMYALLVIKYVYEELMLKSFRVTVEHILSLFFYLHVGFAAFRGWRSNCDRRSGKHAEWRAESSDQPRKVHCVLVAIPHMPLRLRAGVIYMLTPLTVCGCCVKH